MLFLVLLLLFGLGFFVWVGAVVAAASRDTLLEMDAGYIINR